jgi:hypothetical protein
MRERLRDYSTDNHIFVYLENGILRKSSVGLQDAMEENFLSIQSL